MSVTFMTNYILSVVNGIPSDSEMPVVTSCEYQDQLDQSLKGVHRDRLCVFIGLSDHA
jgi:hypothetical protein